ncbi:hypothetical protein N7463_001186 [Penicillium fimorum]|uniref:Uncharacterized protein n=1 Tax=Penicillium fimorum TaxID=1882269 RepID=A0A9W9Y7Y4_9EURO|nr:hypothetical protein N7463_001186 [Penicillium fimorum]
MLPRDNAALIASRETDGIPDFADEIAGECGRHERISVMNFRQGWRPAGYRKLCRSKVWGWRESALM